MRHFPIILFALVGLSGYCFAAAEQPADDSASASQPAEPAAEDNAGKQQGGTANGGKQKSADGEEQEPDCE